METINRTPDPTEAAADLAAAADAQRAVRDRPWPVWLYPANAILLGLMAATPLLADDVRLAAWFVLGLGVFALNLWAGHRMGTPFAVPTSRGFFAGIVASALCLAAALIVGDGEGRERLVVALAVGAALSYAVGSVVHYRSTRG